MKRVCTQACSQTHCQHDETPAAFSGPRRGTIVQTRAGAVVLSFAAAWSPTQRTRNNAGSAGGGSWEAAVDTHGASSS